MMQVSTVGKKILSILIQPYKLDDHEYYGTCSIGAALFSDHHQSAEEVMKRADIALFRSKNSGRNKLTFFSDETPTTVYKHVPFERDMRTVLRS
jgi:GGDEF domain-containing protein